METTFTFRNFDTSDALKTHTLDKLDKIGKYLIKPTKIHVIFNVERFNQIVEVTLNANGVQYVSHEKSEDMYTSIDKAVAKLERQLKKYKEQLKKHKSPDA
ncbi:MAG: ribosome-associated translation inhibitor RaiA [Deltaproteobacteria bacterium]|nr:ribosome-associated translation inhibitor RaiA [Deltaproteobacteria bacterium]